MPKCNHRWGDNHFCEYPELKELRKWFDSMTKFMWKYNKKFGSRPVDGDIASWVWMTYIENIDKRLRLLEESHA